ncbi:MAG: preprotein translocase subunit SecY [Planctomycetes bacterium DG_23]|nr:MAG: preprotein translocase subunit SecY [Planctomycetes bacterium DG_23]
MIETFRNIFKIPELRRKILITLGLLVVFRLGTYVPVPGVDFHALEDVFKQMQDAGGAVGGLFGMINLFVGGAMSRGTVFALGVMPYISASIIFQLLTTSIPSLERLAREGESGRKKIRQYERYLTVGLCLIQGFFFAITIEGMGRTPGGGISSVVAHPGMAFRLTAVIAMTAGTIFLMWLGEQISEYGIGNGISLIIMAGIIDRLPFAVTEVSQRFTWNIASGEADKIGPLGVGALLALFVGIVMGIIYITQGQRRIPIQYAKHVRGMRIYGGQRHYLPLRVNQAGVIPIIFASSLLIFVALMVSGLAKYVISLQLLNDLFRPGAFLYILFYVGLIMFFCFFWTTVTFPPDRMADNLKESGSFIPGIRPGRRTVNYLEKLIVRITLAGAAFLAAIAIIPPLMGRATGFGVMTTFFGGTGILIVVGVALDVVERIEAHLVMRHYEGLTRGGRIRGRR